MRRGIVAAESRKHRRPVRLEILRDQAEPPRPPRSRSPRRRRRSRAPFTSSSSRARRGNSGRQRSRARTSPSGSAGLAPRGNVVRVSGRRRRRARQARRPEASQGLRMTEPAIGQSAGSGSPPSDDSGRAGPVSAVGRVTRVTGKMRGRGVSRKRSPRLISCVAPPSDGESWSCVIARP